VTGDVDYIVDYGAELLTEIARFWVSLASFDAARGRYVIRGVIGPDEFHSGYPGRAYDGIDNNAYTNVMAVWVIVRAMEALELLPLSDRLDLLERLGVDRSERDVWDDVSRHMFVPFHDGVISQFEGYEQLAELDWHAYRQRYRNIQRLDRILEAENDNVNHYKASKQADALMLFYLLSSDELRELLNRLGYRFNPEQIPKTIDYYRSRTSHGSTLSAIVHSWVLARGDRERAMKYFQQVLFSDIADVQGGTTSEGIHLAAMAGSVDLLQRCFTGLEFRADHIVLNPLWPETLGRLAFPLRYRGHRLHLEVSGRQAKISSDSEQTNALDIEYRGRVQRLMPGHTIVFT
jgi:trehalose/maltose hydrolase-like predicted phosphorylase